MRGTNPIRPPVASDGLSLEIKSIFRTLQGEGPDAGTPAVFVRLGGCNLACAFCDTDFEEFSVMALQTVVEQAQALAHAAWPIRLAVITGGEPLRQNIAPLCERLLAAGFRVQIETNGTLWRPLPGAVEIVCSPKNAGGGYFPVREDLLPRVSAFKFIVSAHDPLYRDAAEVGQARFATPVYVQPMDERDSAKNERNHTHAVQLALRHGYRLSLQMHKIVGIA